MRRRKIFRLRISLATLPMRTFIPKNISLIGYSAGQYGFPLQEALVIASLASEWHDEAGTAVDGRHLKHSGETHATSTPKRQDTYLTGTSGRTGFAFTNVSGIWRDDFFQPTYHTQCLGVPDGGPSTVSTSVNEVVSTSTVGYYMEHAEIWLQWGQPPVSSSGTDYSHDRANRYTYVHLAYQSPDNQDYRVAFLYGTPIRLDVTYDGGNTWALGVAVLKDLGNFEKVLQNSGYQISLRVIPSIGNQIIGVEINDGHMLTHQPDKAQIQPPKNITLYQDSDPLLPRNGKIRVVHRNSTLKFAYFPYRFQAVSVTKSPYNASTLLADPSGAFLQVNSLGQVNSQASQNNSAQLNLGADGKISWQMTSSNPDSGDGQGSTTPAALNDVSIVVPAKWSNAPAGTPPGFADAVAQLDSYYVEEVQDWNDVTRTLTTDATITVENYDGRWDGTFGNLAVNVTASNDNGNSYFQRLQGLVDADHAGIQFDRADPNRTMTLHCCDKRIMLKRALGERRIFDGWCIFSAIRYLCCKGGQNDAFLQTIPLYVPPGATQDAPYGPAGYDCPYYSLPRGTGLKPFFEYSPETPIWDILQAMCLFLNSSIDQQGNRATWYMGFTTDGQFHFEPVELYALPLAMSYSTTDHDGLGLIQDKLTVINDVGDLRSSIDFVGLDANSYELLFEHRELPWQVQLVKGYREPWIERSAAFCSADYIKAAADEAAAQCSRPRQRVLFTAPFIPWINAGALISVTDDSIEGGTGLYSIERLVSRYGVNKQSGKQDCVQIILARSIASLGGPQTALPTTGTSTSA